MICEARGDSGSSDCAEDRLQSLGEANWMARGEAVAGLVSKTPSDLMQALLAVVREGHRDFSRLNSALQILARTPVDVVPELLQLLSHPDHEVRIYTALTLGERGDPQAIPGLLHALTDGNTNVRMHAIEALGKLRSTAAVDELIALVEAMDFELAFPALDALIAIGDQRIAHRLVPLLKNNLVKVLVIEALGALGDEEAVKPLLDRLADPDVPPAEVASALCRMHSRYADQYGDNTTIPGAVRSLASAANVQTLIAALSQSWGAGLKSSAQILGWLPGPEADAALANLLDRPPVDDEVVDSLARRGPAIIRLLLDRLPASSEESRKVMVEAFRQVGDRSALPALLHLLTSTEDEELLVRVIGALASLGDVSTYGPLQTFLGHASSRVRQAAVAAVSALGHPSIAADSLAGIQAASPLVRESSVRVAAYLGLPGCLDAILASCHDSDERVRRAAIESLPMFDDVRVYERLADALAADTPPVRAAAAGALAKFDDATAAGTLLAAALNDSDVWVRYFAVRSLMAIGKHGELRESLIHIAAHDPAAQVRFAALEAVEDCGSPATADFAAGPESVGQSGDVATLLQQARGNDEQCAADAIQALSQLRLPAAALALIDIARRPARRAAAVVALAQLGDSAVPLLAAGFDQFDLDLRRAAVEVLARIRSADAIRLLETALDDNSPSVRHAALSALARIRQFRRTA